MLKKFFTVFLAVGFIVNISAAQVMALSTGHKTVTRDLTSRSANGIDTDKVMVDLHKGLEQLKNMDPEQLAYFEQLCMKHLGLSLECTIDEFESIANQYAYEIDFGDWFQLAPGCFSHWVMAFLGIFVLTPYVTYYALLSIYDGDQSCFGKYISWSIASFSLSFSGWTEYRICAEQHKDNPDLEYIEGLNEDKDFLVKLMFISLLIGAAFDIDCESDYLWSDD